MIPITPSIRRMTFEEVNKLKLQNPGLILEYEGVTYHLNADTLDKVHVFTRSICIFVLIINRSLGYIGLDGYAPNEPDPLNSIFLHSDYQFSEYLGPKWDQLSPQTIATRLVDYLS